MSLQGGFSVSGTSPAIMRWAIPSAMAVLPVFFCGGGYGVCVCVCVWMGWRGIVRVWMQFDVLGGKSLFSRELMV